MYKYYTSNCLHWKWKYNYHYPPLLSDLVKNIPNQNISFIGSDNDLRRYKNKAFSDSLQLCYVLPKASFFLLSRDLQKHVKKNEKYYVDSYMFGWAFCRFFWESHVLLPDIKTSELENWNNILI